MLFDMEDYRNAGLIGLDQHPATQGKWDDCWTFHRQTRDAFNKSVAEWISSANICESNCTEVIDELIADRLTNYDALVEAGNIFWGGLVDSTYTKEKHAAYDSALEAYMYTIRKLLSILEGDSLKLAK